MPVNLAISIFPFIIGGLEAFEAVFLSVGFFINILIKELNAKNEYLFYHNNKISLINLWIYSYLLNFIVLVIIVIFYNFIKQLF